MKGKEWRRVFSLFLCFCLILFSAPPGLSALSAGILGASGGLSLPGLGTATDPLLIHTGWELVAFARAYNSGQLPAGLPTGGALHVAIGSALDLTGLDWEPIGSPSLPFSGVFDGGGYEITGLSVSGGEYVGFFGVLAGATVKNLSLKDVLIQAAGDTSYAGGLAGEMRGGLVERCAISGTVQAGTGQYAGLLAGHLSGQTDTRILLCGAEGHVTADYAGGLIGIMESQSEAILLEACHSAALVEAVGDYVLAGGLVGRLEAVGSADAVLSDCYATGDVIAQGTRQSLAGGLVGLQASWGGAATIRASYATGAVRASGGGAYAGGLTGGIDDSSEPVTWQNCGALTASLTAENGTGAVAGWIFDLGYASAEDCFRWEALGEGDLPVTAVSAGNLARADTWAALTGSGLWQTLSDGHLPILEGAAGRQSSALPLHLANPSHPVVISTAKQLAALSDNIRSEPAEGPRPYATGAYELGANLDVSALDWLPLGSTARPFSGRFDGAGYQIHGLTVEDHPAAGLFGVLDGATVENLLLSGCLVSGTESAGAVAGVAVDTIIRDCAASGRIVSTTGQAGGLVGVAENADLARLSFTGSAIGGAVAGGLLGRGAGELSDSHSAGMVAGKISGGLVGVWAGNMARCYTTAGSEAFFSVSGSLVGRLESGSLTNLVGLSARTVPVVGEFFGKEITLDAVRIWEGFPAVGSGILPTGATAFSAADFWREGFWESFEGADWRILPGNLPLLAYDLADREPPRYLWHSPAEGTSLELLCQEGESLPSSSLARTLTVEAVPDSAWQPASSVFWSLGAAVGGPTLTPLDSNRAALIIPGDFVGAVTVRAGLDRWPTVTGSLTITINGDLGQSGAAVHLEQEDARYGDRLTAVFTPPEGVVPAENVTIDWLLDGILTGSGPALVLDRADWIGRAVKIRASAENYASPVESPALLIGKRLFNGTVADPQEFARTGDSLTLTALAGYEYACMQAGSNPTEDDWQRDAHFSGLRARTAYSFYQRIAETATTEASPPSRPLSVTLEEGAKGGEEENPSGPAPGETPPEEPTPGENPPSEEPTPGEDPPPEDPAPTVPDPIAELPALPLEEEPEFESWGETTPDTTTPDSPVALTLSRGVFLARSAAQSAKRNGADVALITLKNPGRVSAETLKAMAATAGMPLLIYADSVSADNQVMVRISLNPARATKDVNLSAAISPATGASSQRESARTRRAQRIQELFRLAYGSETAVISFGQTGDFGMPVEIAAFLEIPGGDPVSLPFWSFQRTTGVYRRIKNASPWRDSNGYTHFLTDQAGDIVVGGPFRVRG
jgi:hypothetical protein